MKDKRILYVSSEVVPYLPETEIASTAFNVAKKAHGNGIQTRIFMPRFGVINERRHQLHEVIRLSGMNLISADVVEVSPAYDHAEVTSLAAATIVYELTNLFAKK